MEDSERAEYWKGAYDRMAARNAEQGLLIAELDAEIRELRTGAYLVKVIEQRERYRKALEPFLKLDEGFIGQRTDNDVVQVTWTPNGPHNITFGHLRAARAALEATND